MKKIAVAGALLSVALIPTLSFAQSNPSLTVSASVNNNCVIKTTALTFVAYDPVQTNATDPSVAQGNLNIACTKGARPQIGITTGQNPLSGARRMAGPTNNYLTYELFQDGARTEVWNDAAGGRLSIVSTSKAAADFPVFGRIAGGQDVAAGAYTDTVTATVHF